MCLFLLLFPKANVGLESELTTEVDRTRTIAAKLFISKTTGRICNRLASTKSVALLQSHADIGCVSECNSTFALLTNSVTVRETNVGGGGGISDLFDSRERETERKSVGKFRQHSNRLNANTAYASVATSSR